MHRLAVLAASAPYWPTRATTTDKTLRSATPASLQQACVVAATQAMSGRSSWADSNWAEGDINRFLLMYDCADQLDEFEHMLLEVRPTLLLLGAMTLCVPGAIQMARMAKEILGDSVTVVLGGRQANETLYQMRDGTIHHHKACLLRLMQEGKAPPVFDVVVSGEGQYLVAELGHLVTKYGTAHGVKTHLDELLSAGTWIAGTLINGSIRTRASPKVPIDYTNLPTTMETFGFAGNFPVFGTNRTAHVYPGGTLGCVFDCPYCSERFSVTGKPNLVDAEIRLAHQLLAVQASGVAEGDSVSAFDDSSLILWGEGPLLRALYPLLEGRLTIPWGGQMTVNRFLDLYPEIVALRRATNLSYVFEGLETANEEVAQTFGKNRGSHQRDSWIARNQEVVAKATEAGLKYGISILFGLGESQKDRVGLLTLVARWQERYNNPCVVSLNWATQHPLREEGPPFDYLDWGTAADSPRLPWFQALFGEASERYTLRPLATPQELEELSQIFCQLKLQQ